MDKEQDKLEQLFKQRFENEELPIPEGMWERMRPSLPPPPPLAENKSDSDTSTAASKPWGKIIGSVIIATFLAGVVLFNLSKKQNVSASEKPAKNTERSSLLSNRESEESNSSANANPESEYYSNEAIHSESGSDSYSNNTEETQNRTSSTNKNLLSTNKGDTNPAPIITTTKSESNSVSNSSTEKSVLNAEAKQLSHDNKSLSNSSDSEKKIFNEINRTEKITSENLSKTSNPSGNQELVATKTITQSDKKEVDGKTNSDAAKTETNVSIASEEISTPTPIKPNSENTNAAIVNNNEVAKENPSSNSETTRTHSEQAVIKQESDNSTTESTTSASNSTSEKSTPITNDNNDTEETISNNTVVSETNSSPTLVNSALTAKSDSAVAVIDSTKEEPQKQETSAQPDTSANKDKKGKQWRGNWIVEGNVGPTFISKNTGALTTSSGLNYSSKNTLPGFGLELNVHRTIKKNFMIGTGISYQRNSMSYETSSSRTQLDSFTVDSSYYSYSQHFDSTLQQVVTDSTLKTVQVSRDTSYTLESTNTVKILSNRYQFPLQLSYQWRSGKFGMYTTLNLLFTYTHYKYGAFAQTGNETLSAEKPALPSNKLTLGVGGTYGMRYFLNQHFFISGKISYQVNPTAHYPKNTISIMGGAGFEF